MIMTNRLDRGFYMYQKEFEDRALEVLRSGWYVLGEQVNSFEEEFAAFTGAGYCVGLASGLDALYLAFRTIGIKPGDEVIVQADTYIASVMGITMNGGIPVFCEPDEYFNIDASRIEALITEKTKAVLAVHLYGQASEMEKISDICRKHGIKLVEDCAQSHGACRRYDNAMSDCGQSHGACRRYDNAMSDCGQSHGAGCKVKMTGTFGDIGCFSFYPSKNLGAFGDGGAIVTDNKEYAEHIRMLRNYGSAKRYYNDEVGINSRLDEIQAGLLRVRLRHLPELAAEKVRLAGNYLDGISNSRLLLPKVREGSDAIWHQFVIRCSRRDELKKYLEENGIATIIHYPVPPHMQKAYEYLGHSKGDFPVAERYADEVLSIPMYNGLTADEQDTVINALNRF